MKLNRYYILALTFCLIITEANYAQTTRRSTEGQTLASRIDKVQHNMLLNGANLANANGSPFINDEFELVKFKKLGNRVFLARYNANLGEMQIKRENDTIALDNTKNLELTFTQSNKVYKTHSYTNKENVSKCGFLVVLMENDSLALLKEELVKFYDIKPPSNSYEKIKPAEFKRLSDVYYYRQGDKVSLLPQKRKDFLKLFPQHSSELKDYIKENKISLKKDEDLITLFEYINTL